ncbi:uncharacterized protein BX663DRAFT_560507 [Cokeromyces recurvatus]|uniref:uncharacterized protein n=1 Tax=Cokeromyces recurvatus TaxID=90255 RepID=UPI0022203568|nr:uncharacterized protein BX663DRAFT_560507 [Cokeromyces recurvatus]KAI7903528.1 hypothetical protein BX663DRAFT_560507 [Cokeromyces recurvatus]
MTKDLDHMLKNLEKQIKDFTLTMDNHQPVDTIESFGSEKHDRNENTTRNSDDVPLQLYYSKTHAMHENKRTFKEESMSTARVLQRSQTARRPVNVNTEMNKLSQSKSMRAPAGRNNKYNKENGHLSAEDEELRLAMQRAWAVLETNNNNENGMAEATEPQHSKVSNNMMSSTGRIQTVPLKTLTIRIYIDDAKTYKAVQLTNLLTTAMIVQYLRKKGLIDNSDDWALFEIDNSRGVERPLREWEIVLNVLTAWDADASNALLVKKYSYHHTLTSECVLQKKIAPMHGWLSIEYKKGKWQKRYCFIKENAIYHAKDNQGTSSSILCHLATYDVYTLFQPLKISPTPYLFAIKAQEKSSMFEKESDYIRFLAVEDQTALRDWVLSIRCAKSYIQYQHYPNRVINPLAPISLECILEDQSTNSIRRHKSTRDLNSNYHKLVEEPQSKNSLPRSDSTRRTGGSERRPSAAAAVAANNNPTQGLSRNPTLKNNTDVSNNSLSDAPLIDCSGSPTFAKGSLLAREEQPDQILYRQQQQQQQQQDLRQQHEETSNTLIHIEDRIKFSKGSLLDQKENGHNSTPVKMSRSVSTREVSSSNNINGGEHRRHVSLRRKPTTGKRLQHYDVPLPNNAAIASLPSPSPPALPSHNININNTITTTANNTTTTATTTLLQIDDTPERFHTRELRERHVKPLLDFDSDKRLTTRK